MCELHGLNVEKGTKKGEELGHETQNTNKESIFIYSSVSQEGDTK